MLFDPLAPVWTPMTEPKLLDDAMPAAGSSLELLQAVYADPGQPMTRRMRAAIAALPFEHPKLAVVARFDGNEGFAAKLEAAIMRTGKLIEATPQPADGGVADPDGSGNIG